MSDGDDPRACLKRDPLWLSCGMQSTMFPPYHEPPSRLAQAEAIRARQRLQDARKLN